MQISVAHCKRVSGGEYVGRPSPLGNPFRIDRFHTRAEVIQDYREWLFEKLLDRDAVVIAELRRLHSIAQNKELILTCWCAPLPCHADAIKSCLMSGMLADILEEQGHE